MPTKIIYVFLIIFYAITNATACTKENHKKASHIQQDVITTILTGSAESPDPILVKVKTLEQKGILSNVVIMESFPVQIKVTGPRSIINELNAMPRK